MKSIVADLTFLVSRVLNWFESWSVEIGGSFSFIKMSFWLNMTLSRLFYVILSVPSLATTESAADLFEKSCLTFARVTLGRSVDFDLPDILSSGMEF